MKDVEFQVSKPIHWSISIPVTKPTLLFFFSVTKSSLNKTWISTITKLPPQNQEFLAFKTVLAMDLATELDHPASRPPNLDDTIQLIILDAIIDDCENVNNRWDGRSPKLSLSRYAAVSKLWQNHVEKKTFSRLALSNEHLSRFDSMFSSFPARGSYLRHIELRTSWADTWWAHTTDDDDQLSTISRLLSSLSNWRAPDDLKDTNDDHTALKYPGLTLEIRSWAGIWANGEVMVDTYTTPQGRPGQITRQAATAFGSSYDRTAPRFETTRSPWLPFSGNVPVVRTLLLRRQTRQSLGPQLVSSILSHLPKCDNLIYEPWLHVRQHIQRRIFLGLGRDLDKGIYPLSTLR